MKYVVISIKMDNTQGNTRFGVVEILHGSATIENVELEHNTFPWWLQCAIITFVGAEYHLGDLPTHI